MYWFRRLLLLLPGRRRTRARELDEELRANLALAIEDTAESRLRPEEAERIARRDFGNLTRAREESREVWLPGWDTLWQDLRYTVRTLARTRAFTLIAVLSLALGIGAAAALFSLVNTVVLKPLAYREPGRIVYVREVVPALTHIYPTFPVNFQHFGFWREHARSFDSLAAIRSDDAMLSSGGEPQVVGTAWVTPALFELLGIQPELGRAFRREEEQPGRGSVAVITDSLWRRRFNGAPGVIGQTIRLDESPCVVIGVLPASFRFPRKNDLGPLPALSDRTEIFVPLQNDERGWGGDYDYIVFGRLRQGVDLVQSTAELNLLEKRIASEHQLDPGLHVESRPLQDAISSPVRTSLMVLLSAVLVLVLIVCVNLANLLLARGSVRAREFSVRIALGASRSRLLFASLMETLLISCAGGALGIVAARVALAAFVRAAPVDLPRIDEVQLDGGVLAFAILLSLVCGLVFGLLPALRLSHADPQTAMRGESRGMTSSRQGLHLREWLVGGQVTFSTLLLVLAGLLVSSLWHVLRVDRGFASDGSLDVRVDLTARYRSVKDRAGFFDLAAERLRALPGVRAVGVANRIPLTGESNVNHVQVEGADGSALDPKTRQLIMINVRFVNQDYFASLGIPLVRGRAIEASDRERNVAVISERLAAKLFPGQNPLGRILNSGSGVNHAQIVGVVGDVHTNRLERDPTLMLYVPFWRQPYNQVSHIVVRSSGDLRVRGDEVRKVIQSIDSGIPAPTMRTMDEIVAESVAQRRFQMRIAAAFAISALLLAALGIYGVVAYGTSLRRREFGIRMALGARAAQVYRLVVWQGLRPVALGLAVGILAAVGAGRFVRSLLFGVSATDGFTLGAVAAGLACVATMACLLPAHSAAQIDTAQVLRDE